MTAGAPVVSLTLAGLSTADLTDGKLTVSFGSVAAAAGVSDSPYLYIHANAWRQGRTGRVDCVLLLDAAASCPRADAGRSTVDRDDGSQVVVGEDEVAGFVVARQVQVDTLGDGLARGRHGTRDSEVAMTR